MTGRIARTYESTRRWVAIAGLGLAVAACERHERVAQREHQQAEQETGSGGSSADVARAVSGGAGSGQESGSQPGSAGTSGFQPQPAWGDTDQRIEISWFAFFEGGYSFTRTREELSAQQLGLVRALRTIDAVEGCAEDTAGFGLSVVDATGAERQYVGDEFDSRCPGTGDEVHVGYDGVAALLASAACLPAKRYSRNAAEAPQIAAGSGCHHGVFNGGSETPDWWYRVAIASAGSYRFAAEDCRDRRLRITLLDALDGQELASAESDTSICTALDYDIPAPGTYGLHLAMRAGDSAGDFYLSVEPTR